jgi:hypothetical protein
MANWFSSLASAIASGTTSSASAVGSTISSWFANKYAPITTTFQTLQGLGPTANPDQLNGLLGELKTQLQQVSGVPGAEFTFETTLASLVGKNDAASISLWSQTCANALSTLSNASSAL